MKRIATTILFLSLIAAASPGSPQSVTSTSIAESVKKSLPLLQATDARFLQQSQCVSCHHNVLTAMTVASVRQAGLAVNEDTARQQLQAVASYAESWRERLQQGTSIPGGPDTISYMLLGLGAENYPPDQATEVMASYLINLQSPDGRWRIQAKRPPIEFADVTVTAASLHALQLYSPKADRDRYEAAIQSAAAWLGAAQPASTEERTFQLLAFGWIKAPESMIEQAARRIISDQNPDGGWPQLLHMPSDAYSTGQALVALQETASLPADNISVQRGLRFLLETQLDDGSWHVKTRSTPIQPYLESGFPHGKDQWISAAATNWATRALALALKSK